MGCFLRWDTLCAIWFQSGTQKDLCYVSFQTVTGFLDSSLELAISCTSTIMLPWLFPESIHNSTCSKQNTSVSHQTHPFLDVLFPTIAQPSSLSGLQPQFTSLTMALCTCTPNQLPDWPTALNSLLLTLSSYCKETMPIWATIFFSLPRKCSFP